MSLHYPPRRNFGRRRWDRFVAAIGIGLGFLLAGFTLSLSHCDSDSPTTSTPPSSQPAATNPTPTPAPTATATPTPGTPGVATSFTLEAVTPSTIHVTYTGQASNANIETWYTSFDDQTTRFEVKQHTVTKGGTVVRSYGRNCIEADADHTGVNMIGGVWFDINQKSFNPHKNPEKLAECRNQCKPRWELLEEIRIITDWTDYTPDTQPETVTGQCFKYQRRLVIRREKNTCTREVRDKGEQFYETRQVQIECPCTYSTPTYSGTTFVEEDRQPGFFTDWWVNANAHVQGLATWKLEIYAASSVGEYNNNDPDYTKASLTKTLTCKEAFDFDLEYHSENHASDVWWSALYKDGVRVWKSQSEFN